MSGIIEKLREENAFLNDMLENAHNRSRLLEQQLAAAHRQGWEQAKREAMELYCNECGQGCPRDALCRDASGIATMDYKEPTND